MQINSLFKNRDGWFVKVDPHTQCTQQYILFVVPLGKPSIKKTIFLLTFVNKRGGGLEQALSIKKTIAKIP